MCPGNILHSKSTFSPSTPLNSLYCGVLLNHDNLFSHAVFDCGYSLILPTHNTESEKYIKCCLHELDDLLVVHQVQFLSFWNTPAQFWRSRDLQILFADQCLIHIEQTLHSWLLIWISYRVQILRVILPEKDRCMHRWSHEHPSNKKIFVTFFHLIVWRTIQHRSQPLIHFFFEWDWTGRKNIAFFFSSPRHCQHPKFQ